MHANRTITTIVVAAILGLLIGMPACGEELTVSAAASLTDAFREVATAFEAKHDGTKVVYNFASSGTLASQIENGAPVDVFASASNTDVDRLQKKGLVLGETKKVFTRNSIVLIVPKDSDLDIKNLRDLRKDSVKRIAIGDPETTPGGRYAAQTFKTLGLTDALKSKLIYGSDIRQVRAYAMQGEVDAAIVFATDANVESIKVVYKIPERLHKKIEYPAAVVKDTKHLALAKDFINFLVSNDGKRILAKFGFKTTRQCCL